MAKYEQSALYREMERFYLLTADDGGEDLHPTRVVMGSLVRKARKAINAEMDEKGKIHQLLQLFYGDWGFHCDSEDYFNSENLYLGYVLRVRKGMPVSLGAIILYLAEKLMLPLYPVDFPTQLMLRADVGEQVAFIDPWNGQYVTKQKLQTLYEGAFGFGAKIDLSELAIADEREICQRFMQLAKHTLIREERNDSALNIINSELRQDPENPYAIRDRGMVLAQIGAYQAAIEDFNYFIEKCPEDPTAFMLMSQLPKIRDEIANQRKTFH